MTVTMSKNEQKAREREAAALLGLLCHWHRYQGEWAVRGPAGLKGQRVGVTRRNGQVKTALLLSVLTSLPDGSAVYTFTTGKEQR